MPPTVPNRKEAAAPNRPRAVRLVMPDGTVLGGSIFLAEGHAQSAYLGTRKSGWVNIVRARWFATGIEHAHVVMQTEFIRLVVPTDQAIPVQAPVPNFISREVVFSLEEGTRIAGQVHLAERQRLSDCLHTCGRFVPIRGARVLPLDQELGNAALNTLCVRTVCDQLVMSSDLSAPCRIARSPGGCRDRIAT